MKVNTDWNIGQFDVALAANVDEQTYATLANLGLRWIGQRNSEVDKVLGGFAADGNGKLVRRNGFKRNEVSYSATLRDALAESFGKLTLPKELGGTEIDCAPVVTQYVAKEATIKFAGERKAYARHGVAGDLEAFAGKVGYAGDDLGDGTAENAPEAFLRAIKSYVDSL